MSEKQYEDGEADARMGDEDTIPSRFRPRYRKLSDLELANIDAIKELAGKLDGVIANSYAERVPKPGSTFFELGDVEIFEQIKRLEMTASREHALAVTKLQEAVMWAVNGLTAAKVGDS